MAPPLPGFHGRPHSEVSVEIIRELGRQIEARWRTCNYDERRFPDLAVEALENTDSIGAIEPLDLLRWIASESALPRQVDAHSQFSDLALSFYETARFNVSALFWLDGSTAIHQHEFSGAFRVMSGSSLHCRFRFREERLVNRHFRLGTLELDAVDLLSTGSVHPIESHSGFIHSLFHLERPSLSLVVRTNREPGTGPQWSYYRPGIAVDPFFEDSSTTKKLEAVRVLSTFEPEAADAELTRMLDGADLPLTYQLVKALSHQLKADPLEERFAAGRYPERFDRLVEVSRRRHGDVVDRLVLSAEEDLRQARIITMRALLTRPEQRFLLALLLNFPGKETVLELMAQRYPDRDPVEEFLDRIQDLATTRSLGSPEANLLGIPDFDIEHRAVLRRLLLEGSVEEAATDLVALLNEDPSEASKLAEEITASLQGAPLLRALFQV